MSGFWASARNAGSNVPNACTPLSFLGHDSPTLVEVEPGLLQEARRQLLQENGYLVLRFLAGDIARDLDAVLDAMQRALGGRSIRRVKRRAELQGSKRMG